MLNEFPGAAVSDSENQIDKIAELFMGTRNTRLAGLPNPESQVQIRKVIRHAILCNQPIPVLVGSGPKKNRDGQIDLAELAAMRTLACMQKSTQQYYEPGFSFRIRLEDATGIFLEGYEAAKQMEPYCRDFKRLCEILNQRISPTQFLFPYLESNSCTSLYDFLQLAESFVPAFEEAHVSHDDSEIIGHGWKGGFTDAWRVFLDDRYSKLYPHFSTKERINMAAKYLSVTLARSQMQMRGATPEWAIEGQFLELNFAPPSPGAPSISSRVYYRTMSVKQTKLHVPFWRGKGYFRLVDGELKMGLARGTDSSNRYIPGYVVLDDGYGNPLRVQADLLEDILQ
jgi:hypothetical protein